MFDKASPQERNCRVAAFSHGGRSSRPPGAAVSPNPARGFALFGTFLSFLSTAILILFLVATVSRAHAQDSALHRGDAVVTGFSGIKPSNAPLPKGANPLDEFFIDPNGPSAQILSLAAPGGTPEGQLISAPPTLQIKASQVGQVFAVTLDDGLGGKVPNIYLGATSAYGLHIVTPDADGDGWSERAKTGAPDAEWMSAQFGATLSGGPGSIYKIDGQTGAASLFATLPDNSGPGIGDVVFDKASRQFFASDLDSGLIYRLSETGEVIDSFDHGVKARPAKGLSEVADDGKKADIHSPAFDSQNPDSWGYTPDERRVYGLVVNDGRLYYAVHGQVWSVGVSADGFADDARWELDVEGLPGDGPITDMLFDKDGRMYLAQRGRQRASYDYSVFAEPEKSAVVRYRREEPDDPATESVWVADPESYAIGLPPEHNHAEGGIALGYGYDETGAMRYGACGQMLWSTGHRLRPSVVAEAGNDGKGDEPEADVHGLQGNEVSLVRPQNVPPQQSYFADYDGFFGDAANAGHVGDIEIWQPCEGAPDFASSAPGELPPGILPPGDVPPELPPEFPPDYDFHTNLRLVKRAMPKSCWDWGNGWLCRYGIRVTNTGPDNYFGPILLDDWLPANPAGAMMGFSPTPTWTCWKTGPSAYRCFRPGVFLAPSWSVNLTAYAWVPKAKDRCHLRNVASIEWAPGGTQWNTDPLDDSDGATALIPDKDCSPHGGHTDLKIYKRPLGPCFRVGDHLRCGYRVTVENEGPGAYNGDIVVDDKVPAGTTAVFSGPGWACGGVSPNYTCKYAGASLPNPGDTLSFTVRVDLSVGDATHMHCKVPNRVKITEAQGGTPKNTDPSNDEAGAVATVPGWVCGDALRTNLKIEKKADPTFCSRSGDDWWCRYAIRVTNTGPGVYNGPIEIDEALPAEPLDAHWNAPWTCQGTGGSGATCKYPITVIPPTGWRTLYLRVKFSGDVVREKNCALPNVAKITKAQGGTPKNTDPGDDIAGDSAKVPATFCRKEPTNLELRKLGAQPKCNTTGGGLYRCPYNVIVKNTGDGDYDGKIVVRDDLPQAAAGATMQVPAPWNCVGSAPSIICTHPSIKLQPGQQVIMPVNVLLPPAGYGSCALTNSALILQAPGGTVQNQEKGDDKDSATLQFPPLLDGRHSYCVTPIPAQPCPPGFDWNGERCNRIGLVPPPPPPPGRECPDGYVGNYPDCRKISEPTPECPEGTVGRYPHCRRIGQPTPECTGGRILRAGHCVCRHGIWNGERCVRRQCPEGTRGIYPHCRKIVRTCPEGYIGRPPHCRKIVRTCPEGYVGRPPHCRKIIRKCPEGMVGRPPHCHRIVRRCPEGMVGRPPHCRRLQLNRQHFQLLRPDRGSHRNRLR